MRIRVLSWDYREQPDWDAFATALAELTGGQICLRLAETRSDQYAVVLAIQPLDQEAADEAYREWCRRPAVHHNGDKCPDGGHIRPDGSHCVHVSWTCDHCHDDPPPGHRCSRCQRTKLEISRGAEVP